MIFVQGGNEAFANLLKRLKQDLNEHEIYMTADKGWTGVSNGKLLELLITNKFDALLTFDKNLQHQQNFGKYPIAVIVLNTSDNSYLTLKGLVQENKKSFNNRFEIRTNCDFLRWRAVKSQWHIELDQKKFGCRFDSKWDRIN